MSLSSIPCSRDSTCRLLDYNQCCVGYCTDAIFCSDFTDTVSNVIQLSAGIIAAIVIGSLVVCAGCIGFCVWLCVRSSRGNRYPAARGGAVITTTTTQAQPAGAYPPNQYPLGQTGTAYPPAQPGIAYPPAQPGIGYPPAQPQSAYPPQPYPGQPQEGTVYPTTNVATAQQPPPYQADPYTKQPI